MSNTPEPLKVGILIFDQVEVLDFCGPFEVFGVASENRKPSPFEVFTIAQSLGPIVSTNGLSINPLYTTSDCPLPDVLVVPGGAGTRQEIHNKRLLSWIIDTAQSAQLVLSVCTGALLLGRSGLLDNLTVTTHYSAIELLQNVAPLAKVETGRRFVDSGKIITAAGISAGIDASLHVVSRLASAEIAEKTARQMEYEGNWKAST